MTSASTTSYTIQSNSPKDIGGYRFAGLIRGEASVAPITLYKGIGTSEVSNMLFSHLAIGSHTGGSKVGAAHPGVLNGGYFLANQAASSAGFSNGQFVPQQASRYGELMVSSVSKFASMLSTSTNTVATSYIHGISVAFSGVTVGDSVSVRDGLGTQLYNIFPSAATETVFVALPQGGIKLSGGSATIQQLLSTGAASTTILLGP